MLNLSYAPESIVDTEGMSNEEWLRYRTRGIGGSDVSAIYGISPWTTARALYFVKRGLAKEEPENQFTLDFGHVVEPLVAAWFQNNFEKKFKKWLEGQMGKAIRAVTIYKDTVMYRHPLYPFMNANLDYRIKVMFQDGETREGIFECKTTNYHIFNQKWGWNKLPPEYVLQVRHYMSVMNLPFCVAACLCGNNENDYAVAYTERDLDTEEEIIMMESSFWNKVQSGTPPALNLEHADQELAALASFSIEKQVKEGKLRDIIPTPSECKQAIRDYLAAQETLAALNKRCKELENVKKKAEVSLRLALANAPGGSSGTMFEEEVGGDKYQVTVSFRTTTRVNSDKLKKEAPKLFEEYKKTTTTESLSMSKVLP